MLVYADLYNLRLSQTAAGDSLSLPTLVAGQELPLSFRFLDVIDGATVEKDRELVSLKASIGYVDERPKTGQYKIKINGSAQSNANTTAAIEWNATPSDIEAKLNALSAKVAAFTVKYTEGSYLILCGGEQIDISVVSNTLSPISFGRFTIYQVNGVWVHELRLMQAPLTFTDAKERILPPPPKITTLQDGGYIDAYTKQNEIQQLIIPPEFRGTYQTKLGFKRTALLDPLDGPDEIKAAIDAMLAGLGIVDVTNPTPNAANIEFKGDMAAMPVDEMTVEVYNAPPGDWSVKLVLDTPEIRAAMRGTKTLDGLPIEIEGTYWVDPADHDQGTKTFKIATTLTLTRPLIWPDMAMVQHNDWQRPPSPKDYKDYTLDQIIIGQQHYAADMGDGDATEFVLDHNFGTLAISGIIVIENDDGRFLAPDEYEANATSEDSLTLTFPSAPGIGAYRVILTAAGPTTAFEAHTHTIDQIVDLGTILEDLGSRIVTLEEILPSTGPVATAASLASGIEIKIPKLQEVLFLKDPSADLFDEDGVVISKLPKNRPLMLPAVHDATVTNALVLPDPVANANQVFTNGTGEPQPLGSGNKGGTVAVGGLFASDGRVPYAVNRSGETNSYYPRGFERVLFPMFIDETMLAPGRRFDLDFGLGLQLINATSYAQYILVIEKGAAPSQTTPATTGLNLENIVWDTAEPMLTQRLILTSLYQTHSFGLRIKRVANVITMDTILNGIQKGANALAPADANFALRVRLINFDTENALANDAKGWVFMEITDAQDASGTPVEPRAIII